MHNVNVNVQGYAEITVKNMVESNYTHLTGANGDILVENVKTANLIVQTERGDVLCNGAIQVNTACYYLIVGVSKQTWHS